MKLVLLFVCFFLVTSAMNAQNQSSEKPRAKVQYISEDFDISDLNNKAWKKAKSVKTKTYWSGEKAPKGRRFKTKLLWSDTALYVRFVANQKEPLVVSKTPDLSKKTKGLWDRDVCEIFLAPNKNEFRKYFEFEVAPTGEWIDLGIHQLPGKRETDWDYNSGMKTAAKIEKKKVIMSIKIEWKAFGNKPNEGDIWLGNILRAMGSEPNRGYLAWSATMTDQPNFHVPEKFGEFEFKK